MADDDDRARPPGAHDASGPVDEPTFGGRDLIGLGGFLVGAVVGGLVLGLLLDRQFDTSPVFVLVGIGVGIALGAFGFWSRVKRALRG